jgi:hypothetical protein
MLRCTYCHELVELIHGRMICGSATCPLHGLDQAEPVGARTSDEDEVSIADVLRPSSPGHVPAVLDAG